MSIRPAVHAALFAYPNDHLADNGKGGTPRILICAAALPSRDAR